MARIITTLALPPSGIGLCGQVYLLSFTVLMFPETHFGESLVH